MERVVSILFLLAGETPRFLNCIAIPAGNYQHTMISFIIRSSITAFVLCLASCTNGPIARVNQATSSASKISADSRSALRSLYASNPGARALGQKAKAVLVFPNVTRAGLMAGGQTGTGAMIRDTGAISGYYQTTSASYGLQAGIQQFGYALFFMNDDAFRNINRSSGWEIGGSPSLVVVDKGMATSLTNATLNKNTYAVFFNQRGLMAGLGLQGSKISRIYPK